RPAGVHRARERAARAAAGGGGGARRPTQPRELTLVHRSAAASGAPASARSESAVGSGAMFTGIIEELGTVTDLRRGRESAVLTVRAPLGCSDARPGDSI